MTLENLTDTDYTYDPVQRLEIYDGSKWLVVPDKQEAVIMMLYTLPGGGTDDVTFNFSAHYDKLTEGRYRIVIPPCRGGRQPDHCHGGVRHRQGW